jgi:hypothetical protein
MTFRHRIMLVATAAVAVSGARASAPTALYVADQLQREVDDPLRETALGVQRSIAGLRQPGGTVPLALPPGVAPSALRQIFDLGHRRPPAPHGQRLGRLQLRTPRTFLGQDRGVFQLLGAGGRCFRARRRATTLPVI